AQEPASQSGTEAQLLLQRRPPAGDEVVAGIAPASSRIVGGRDLRPGHGSLSHVDLGMARAARELLDRVAVAIACREVHVEGVGLRAQDLVDQAEALEEVLPVERRHETTA